MALGDAWQVVPVGPCGDLPRCCVGAGSGESADRPPSHLLLYRDGMQGEPGPRPSDDAGPTGAVAPVTDDVAARARRRAFRAALVQLASPFVYSGTLLAGLAWEIPLPEAGDDPHGYVRIVAFLGSLLLLLIAVAVAGAAALMLQSGRRWGGVLLAAAAGLACLESIGLAVGAPSGIGALVPVRVATIVVGIVWFAVSAVCLGLGVRAFRTLPPHAPR